jgi:hypothetical protein
MEDLLISAEKIQALADLSQSYDVHGQDLITYAFEEHRTRHELSEILCDSLDIVRSNLSSCDDETVREIICNLPSCYRDCINNATLNASQKNRVIALNYLLFRLARAVRRLDTIIIRESNFLSGRVFQTFPELKEKCDDDNLLILDDELELVELGVRYKHIVLYYHPFFRRGFGGSLNNPFLSNFRDLYNKAKSTNSFRIKIDPDIYLPESNCTPYIKFEFDTWYGPGFSESRLADPYYVGFTKLGRNINSLFYHNNNLEETQFYWKYKDGVKTFESEELLDINKPQTPDYFLTRYSHAEWNISEKNIQHFDGAVKVYSQSEYMQRRPQNMPEILKVEKYFKMFRIDGTTILKDWIESLGYYYWQNEMLIEYFDPDSFKERFELRIRDFLAWQAQQNIQG